MGESLCNRKGWGEIANTQGSKEMPTITQVQNALVSYAGYSLEEIFSYDWNKLNECILLSFGAGTEESQEKLAALQEAASNPVFSSARMLFSLFYIRLYAFSQKKEIDSGSLDYFKLSSENEEEVADYIASLGIPRPVIEKKESKVLTPFDEILVRTFNLEPAGIESFKRSFMQKQGLLRKLALALQAKPFTGSSQQTEYCKKLVEILAKPIQRFPTFEEFTSHKEEAISPVESQNKGTVQPKKEEIKMDSSPMEKGREYSIHKMDGTEIKGEVTFIVPKVTVRVKTEVGSITIPFAQIKGWVAHTPGRAKEALQEVRKILAKGESERSLIQTELLKEIGLFRELGSIIDSEDLAWSLRNHITQVQALITRLEKL